MEDILKENYNNIVQLMCQIKLSTEELESIKSSFKDNINSLRRYENIYNMNELIKILEKRYVIAYNNIVKLYDIVEKFDVASKQNIGKHLNNQAYWLSQIPPAPINLTFYGEKQMSFSLPQFSLPIEVTEYISSKIKRFAELARELQIIQEKEIDRIEEYNGDKTKKCLEIYVREANSQRLSNPYVTLLCALERMKRRDVKEHVERLISEFQLKRS